MFACILGLYLYGFVTKLRTIAMLRKRMVRLAARCRLLCGFAAPRFTFALPPQQGAVGAGALGDEADHCAHRRKIDQIGMRQQPEIGDADQLLRRDADQIRMRVGDEA